MVKGGGNNATLIDIYSGLSKEAPGDTALLKLKKQECSLPNTFNRKNKIWLFASNNCIIMIIKHIFNEATPTLEAVNIHRHVVKALI